MPNREIDPVCGMSVFKDSKFMSVYKGHTYHFCSEYCMHTFEKEPEAFVSPEEKEPAHEE